MHKVGIIADDLTGSCDTGAKFAGKKIKVRVFIKPQFVSFTESLPVVNTQSRFLSKEDAYKKAFRGAALLKQFDVSIVFKKIDTMLRGNVGPEIEAVMKALNLEIALVIPAIPGMGRVTIDGHQLINGVRLDKLLPSLESDSYHLPTFLARECCQRVEHIDLTLVKKGRVRQEISNLYKKGNKIIVLDAEKQEEIEQIVKAAMDLNFLVLLVGSLGLAEALSINTSSRSNSLISPFYKSKEAILIVSASSNPVTQKQFEYLEKMEYAELITMVPEKRVNSSDGINEKKIKNEVKEGFRKGKDAVLRTPVASARVDGKVDNGERNRLIIDHLTSIASSTIASAQVGGLILIGGETSYNLCKKIGADTIDVFGEVEPGTAYGIISDGEYMGMPLIIKGGSVGTRDSLVRSLCYLRDKN